MKPCFEDRGFADHDLDKYVLFEDFYEESVSIRNITEKHTNGFWWSIEVGNDTMEIKL